MSSPGCLLLLPFAVVSRALGGGSARKALGKGAALPPIAWERVHTDDRPVIARARAAAEGCFQALEQSRKDLGPEVVGAAQVEIAKLLERVIDVAAELSRARAFVKQNDPEALGRERANLELEALSAKSAHEKQAIEQSLEALAERGQHARTVQGEIGVLQARLLAAVAAMEALRTRMQRAALTSEEASIRAQTALAELKSQQQEAERALQAYAATAREMARLSKT
jgi:DNA repair exonuclease SbcCD ATPase subunit